MKVGTSEDDAVTTTSLRAVALVSCLFFIFISTFPVNTHGKVLERIVAIVNDDIILLSELNDALDSAEKSGKEVNKKELLSDMVDRILLLQEAKKFRIGTGTAYKKEQDAQAVIKEFIHIKIRAFIHIPQKEIEEYYRTHRDGYPGKSFFEARDEIENILVNERLKTRLRAYIEELRAKSYIRIQL